MSCERARCLEALLLSSLALLLALPSTAAATPIAPPRPLSPAERYGAEVASRYLAAGPTALWEALSKGAPLRDVGRESALKEIEVRAGSREGARWELRTPPRDFPGDRVVFSIEHPSGLDEAIVLGVVREDGGFRIRSLRSLTEPPLSLDADRRREASKASERVADHRLWLAVAASALAALLLGGSVLLRRRRIAAVTLAGLGVAAMTGAVVAFAGARPGSGRTGAPPTGRVQLLASVLPHRVRLEKGEPIPARPTEGAPAAVVRLWEAQLAQQRGDTKEATRLLAAAPTAAEIPWADVLRGRVAFMAKNERESVAAYQRVIDEGLYHDGLLTEALDAFSILGYPTGREWSLEKLIGYGPRSADGYYMLARELQRPPKMADPLEAFKAGWRLRPMDRPTLFAAGPIWEYLRQPDVLRQLRLGEPVEEGPAPDANAERATRVCGTVLRETFAGGGELVVPGGAEFAPAGTPGEDPSAGDREASVRALADLPALTGKLRDAGAMSQPALRRQLQRTSVALARRHRWPDLVRLTAGTSGSVEQTPPLAVLLRAEALRRTGRVDEAKQLLLALEKNPLMERLGDPGLFIGLGNLMRAAGDLAGSIRSFERAARLQPTQDLRPALSSLRAEQGLESAFATQIVGRFDLRFRQGAALSGPIEVGRILTSEWSRMSSWFPSLEGRPVVVDLLPWVDFAQTYGTDILGLYDGKIRLPVFGVPRFTPPIVSLLTHELAHAMIADATRDRAPSWFHEGLAQRLEMRPARVNRIADLEKYGTFLSIASIEEALRSHPDPELVEAAYLESEWIVLFVERKFGRAAIPRLVESFRDGRTTDEAVPAAIGLTVGELDQRFRTWAAREAPKRIDEASPVRYDLEPR